jgi:4-hydroxybenzoate polyprenyltransferase
VSPRDLSRLNAAFFTMNGVIAMVFLAFVAVDLWLRS